MLILLQMTIIALNNTTEKNRPAGYIFTRYDDRIVMRRQIRNEIHEPEFREFI